MLSASFSEQCRIYLLINQNIHIKQYFVWKKYSTKLALNCIVPFYNDGEEYIEFSMVNIFNYIYIYYCFGSFSRHILLSIFSCKFCAREILETTRLIFMNFAIEKIMIWTLLQTLFIDEVTSGFEISSLSDFQRDILSALLLSNYRRYKLEIFSDSRQKTERFKIISIAKSVEACLNTQIET